MSAVIKQEAALNYYTCNNRTVILSYIYPAYRHDNQALHPGALRADCATVIKTQENFPVFLQFIAGMHLINLPTGF